MKIGVCIRHNRQEDIRKQIADAVELGFDNAQLITWDSSLWTEEQAQKIRNACDEFGFTISAVWVGWCGPSTWNFYEGQETLGLVPVAYRFARLQDLCNGSDFAKLLGVQDVVTHVGFIPENPHDPNYLSLVTTLKVLMRKVTDNGQRFLFETGQETPVTLMRAIADTGFENMGINLDPANLLLYGKANPVDAVGIFGKKIWGVHAKDGMYPTGGYELGQEKALGEGMVNFPRLIQALADTGYEGALTIEREISGDQQIADIKAGKKLLESCLEGIQ